MSQLYEMEQFAVGFRCARLMSPWRRLAEPPGGIGASDIEVERHPGGDGSPISGRKIVQDHRRFAAIKKRQYCVAADVSGTCCEQYRRELIRSCDHRT